MAAFLDGQLPWTGIAEVVADALDACEPTSPSTRWSDVLEADRRARRRAEACGGPPEGGGVSRAVDHGGPPVPPAPDGPGRARRGPRRGPDPVSLRAAVGARPAGHRGGRRSWPSSSWPGWRPLLIVITAMHRDGDGPRAGPLRHGQVGPDEGHRVLRGLRSPAVVGPAGRDRVRDQGHPGRGLREDPRHEQHGGDRPGRRGPHLPPGAVPQADHRGLRRVVHALRHGLPPRLQRHLVLRHADHRPRGGGRRLRPLARPHPDRGPRGRAAGGGPGDGDQRSCHHGTAKTTQFDRAINRSIGRPPSISRSSATAGWCTSR